uniref:PDZ domain-containing protein n=1 Tax=Vespula pensylvanica TaxID=30213 RepID=A0A834NSS7_VESPE|nr:hypothetical protein H0235_011822 [Vespula pensylvanica]
MSSLKGDKTPYARLCHIVKWDDFDGYGFNLHAEKGKNGQYIGKVDEGSPSQAAGLKQGDRIIEVNEINIANETHKQVVERIKAFPNETKLLVLDQEADEYFRANNVVVKGTMANVKVIKTPERNPNSVDHEEGSDHGISADERRVRKQRFQGSLERSIVTFLLPSRIYVSPSGSANLAVTKHVTRPTVRKVLAIVSQRNGCPTYRVEQEENLEEAGLTDGIPLSTVQNCIRLIKVIVNARKSSGSNDTEHSDSTATTVNASTIAVTTTMTTTASSTTMSSLSSENEETSVSRENGSANSRNSETTEAHVHGTGNGTVTGNNEPRQGLNLKMSAKELRAQLAARKKYDPKKESIGFKDKFDIVQKL